MEIIKKKMILNADGQIDTNTDTDTEKYIHTYIHTGCGGSAPTNSTISAKAKWKKQLLPHHMDKYIR
jgi:hypothetical protein